MPRTAITVVTPKGPYPGTVAANDLDLTQTAADVANKNSAVFSGNRMLLIAENDNVAAKTVTLTSVADARNRTGDVTSYSIGASEIAAFVLEREGWCQSDGAFYCEAEHADVKFTVLALP